MVSLPRVRLFEVNDASWAPAALRETLVESLSRALVWSRALRGLAPPFARFVAAAGAREVLDLCAGAGGPAAILAAELARCGTAPPRFLLTDLRPRRAAWERARAAHRGVIDFVDTPVDATCIPPALAAGRARVMINALHHFPPPLAARILADAAAGASGIFVAEAFERNPLRFLPLGPAGLPALLLNPLLSPGRRLAKALWTWASPVVLASAIWDGVISSLRVYTAAELRALVAPAGHAFVWTYGTYDYGLGGRGTYFFGVPRVA